MGRRCGPSAALGTPRGATARWSSPRWRRVARMCISPVLSGSPTWRRWRSSPTATRQGAWHGWAGCQWPRSSMIRRRRRSTSPTRGPSTSTSRARGRRLCRTAALRPSSGGNPPADPPPSLSSGRGPMARASGGQSTSARACPWRAQTSPSPPGVRIPVGFSRWPGTARGLRTGITSQAKLSSSARPTARYVGSGFRVCFLKP
mmetsp:Transcript_19674/g.62567  ORF Transcript_19674/g.62567 Transcript_19674/m.62567 type:complete len:203 (+) Transcript_19674:483-1091(+)